MKPLKRVEGLQSSLHQSHTSSCNSLIFLAHCINIVFQNKRIVFPVLFHYCSNYAKFFIVQFMACFDLPCYRYIIAYPFKFAHSIFHCTLMDLKKPSSYKSSTYISLIGERIKVTVHCTLVSTEIKRVIVGKRRISAVAEMAPSTAHVYRWNR